MKTTITAIIMVFAISMALVLSGCANSDTPAISLDAGSDLQDSSETDIEDESIDPDIGELDDFAVSDELPE